MTRALLIALLAVLCVWLLAAALVEEETRSVQVVTEDIVKIPPRSTTTVPPSTTTTAAPRHVRVITPQPSIAAVLEGIKRCESGGDYRAVSKSGRYKGAYQADDQTWGGFGGYSRADEAPPAVQDEWARQLYMERGKRPWPTCGRRAA